MQESSDNVNRRLREKTLIYAEVTGNATRNLAAALLGLIACAITLLQFLGYFQSSKTQPAQEQILELQRVQESLKKLQGYVEQQEHNVKTASQELDSLSKQKGDVENVLSIDRPRMEALLATVNKQSNKMRWIEYGLSFILGVFSSLTATFGYEWLRKLRLQATVADNEEPRQPQ